MSPLVRLQAINAGSPDVHINLQYKKWKEAGKMVKDNHAHQTQIYKKEDFFLFFQILPSWIRIRIHMDIFGIPDPDPLKNLCRSKTLPYSHGCCPFL